ncbi:MAG: hypothetical protein M9890_13800 [Thermomicrobiales bacterium]|nr:hypothetical protein [Thermomicrobiales bacterium]
MVTREGSELARCLQRRGWRATLGWRSETDDGSVWLVRFEPADEPETEVGGMNDDAVAAGSAQVGS